MEYLQVISVPIIATIVYWVINLIKYATNNNERFKRLIPILSASIGVLLGIICYYTLPEIIPASNILSAILTGGASGLSATGTNQIIKQLSKEDNNNGNTKNEDN